jgi:hypothetical protein
MDAVKRQAQREMDHEILAYVRGMQQHAPVTEESIHGFLTGVRRRRITVSDTRDRIAYLVSAGYLLAKVPWGEETSYTITALGMELEDGLVPPRDWKP